MTLPEPSAEMLARLDDLLCNPQGRRFGVLGLGAVGKGMVEALVKRGARVEAVDAREQVAGVETWSPDSVTCVLGEKHVDALREVEALAISPGVDPRQPLVRKVIERNVPVFGELELVGALDGVKVVAITGTNGKSTTTSLIGHLLKSAGHKVFVGGNLGDPVVAWQNRGDGVDYAVIEVSSFQLDSAYRFQPTVSIITNVTPDHGDRYDSHQHYINSKARVLRNMQETDVAILNRDDPTTWEMRHSTRAKTWFFSSQERSDGHGVFAQNGIVHAVGEDMRAVNKIVLKHDKLLGPHNEQNTMAALLALHALGALQVEGDSAMGYGSFKPLKHRLELVAEVDGVRYVNDSKATNDDAAAVSVRSFDAPVHLLIGGYYKGGGFPKTVAASRSRAQRVFAFGAARDAVVAAFEDEGGETPEIALFPSMQAACDAAHELAQPGSVVLLAPACSSFDEFDNYMARGDTFRAWAQGLAGDG